MDRSFDIPIEEMEEIVGEAFLIVEELADYHAGPTNIWMTMRRARVLMKRLNEWAVDDD